MEPQPQPHSEDHRGRRVTAADHAARLSTPAAPGVRRVTWLLAVLAVVAVVAALWLDVWLRVDGATRPSPRWFVAAGLALAGAAAVVAAWDRRQRDLPRRSVALLVLVVALGVVFFGQAVNYLIIAGATGPFEDWVEAIPLVLGAPLWLLGLLMLTWPPGMTRKDLLLVVVDSVVAALALAVFWMRIVVPMHEAPVGLLAPVVGALDPWVQYGAVLTVVVTAAASRRSGSLPIRQLIVLQSAVLVYVWSDVAGDAGVGGDLTEVRLSTLGYVLAAWLFRSFAVAPALEAEDARGRRLRSVWTVAIPFLPIPMAALAVFYSRFTTGPATDGQLAVLLVALVAVVTANGVLRLIVAHDLERLTAQQMVPLVSGSPQQAWFEAVLGDSRDVITVVDRDGTIVYQTPSAAALIGLEPGALYGKHVADLFEGMSRRGFVDLLVRASHDASDRGPYEFTLVDAFGRQHDTETMVTPLRNGGDGYVLTTIDVTDRRRLRAALADSSTRDQLTGLANREGFLSHVREDVPAAALGAIAVVLMDLVAFRDLNDSRGHSIGDEVLRAVAAALDRMPDSVRAVGRTGPDEFGLLVAADPVEPELGEVERTLRDSLRQVFLSDGSVISIGFAMGFAVRTERTEVAGEILERADLALSAARTRRVPAAVAFEADMRSALVTRLRSEADLRDALDSDRLVVHYQPIVSLPEGRLESVEALARLVTPDGALVGPASFIPHAEELGLIDRIGTQVLTTALNASTRLALILGREVPVAVNVSPIQVDDGFPQLVADALAEAALPADQLVLELTENLIAENPETVGAILEQIRLLGCRVALDDFGTGYSSLSYLAGLPIDLLKIDKSFVGRLGSSGDSFVLVRTLLQLAQNLGLATVAEGVETVEQADILRGMNCNRAQGYLFARPMSLADLELTLQVGGGLLPIAMHRGPSGPAGPDR